MELIPTQAMLLIVTIALIRVCMVVRDYKDQLALISQTLRHLYLDVTVLEKELDGLTYTPDYSTKQQQAQEQPCWPETTPLNPKP
tara:strand:- start:1963 stop:2217 length:255 start_codon:yes stop_codon:yes gene_type:complete